MPTALRPLFALLIAGLFGSPALGQSEPRLLTVTDQFDLKSVGSPSISPEGDWVAYTVSETDLKKDSRETAVWIASLQDETRLRMTGVGSSASNPQWSPDGKYLSFTSSRNDEKSQVWVLDRRGGEARMVTSIKRGVGGYAWAPSSDRLLLSLRDERPDDTTEAKDKKPKPHVIDRLQFKRDYTGYLDSTRTHLYLYFLEDSSLVQITDGPQDDSGARWSPDGSRIAFVSNRTENPDANSNTDIFIVDADTNAATRTVTRLTDNPGSDSSPRWSPDGTALTYTTSLEPDAIWYQTRHLAVQTIGGQPRILTRELDRNVSSPRFDASGQAIIFELEDSAERHLASIPVAGGPVTRLIDGHRSVRGFELGPKGVHVLTSSDPTTPRAIYRWGEGGLSKLTSHNDELMAQLKLAEVENVHFESPDGTEIEGFLLTPPAPDGPAPYPTILRIHGGPVSQYDAGFNFEAQLFAASGYAVIMTNPRGSSGYGQAFSYEIWQDWGNKDFQDVNAGVDYLVERGIADPSRLGVGGWSYGGMLTNYAITKTGRFKAAITGASEVLYRANYGHDHYQLQWEKELGLPWENAEAWEAISPFNQIGNVTTPTLVMGGALDWNVPIMNSEQIYQALKRLGVETQLIVYPGEHHGIRKPTFQKDRHDRYLQWYNRYLMNSDKPEG